jgi:hypothetical protein
MVNDNGIVSVGGDAGEVTFDADFDTGKLSVTVRSPLAVNRSSAQVEIPDAFELLANLLLASVAAHKKNAAKLAAMLAAAKKGAK